MRLEPAWDEAPRGLPLIVALAGYRDAGQVVPQLTELLLDEQPDAPVASFDIDVLFDYRARRPIVEIDGTRLGGVQWPELTLHLLHDALGQPYLFLGGAEPDFRWRTVTGILADLVAELEVSSTTWVHSFAMPVPHTRPVRLSVAGNRGELAEQLSVWSPQVAAPAHLAHALGARLAERGHPSLGLVALIPHYVAESPVPAGTLAVVEGIGTVTGLMIATGPLREADRNFRQTIDDQVAGNEEAQRLIAALEQQHDAYLAGLPTGSTFAQAGGSLPSADEIASELEGFLAARSDREDDGEDGKG